MTNGNGLAAVDHVVVLVITYDEHGGCVTAPPPP